MRAVARTALYGAALGLLAAGVGAQPGVSCQSQNGTAAGSLVVLKEEDCDGKCKGDKLARDGSGPWTCQQEVTSANGRLLIADYRSCMSHTTSIVSPPAYVWDRNALAVVLLCWLLYLFLGVAVVADQFMVAIECITSKEKTIMRTDLATGEQVAMKLKFWNPTVANLSLLALGSSAPEILLAVIETVSNLGGPAGELGASTIVGSAAFNLLVISAVCIISVPTNEVRRVTQIQVFMCTSVWSLFAYIWLDIVLDIWTPDEVTPIEAALTFLMFPALLASSYIVDKRETRASAANKHLADDSGTGGWIGGADFKETHALRVLDSHGDVIGNRNEISKLLKAAEGSPEDAAKALMKLMPVKPISRIQARINAAKSMAGKRYLATVDVSADALVPPPPKTGSSSPRAASGTGDKMHKIRTGNKKDAANMTNVSFGEATKIGKESEKLIELDVILSKPSSSVITVDFHTTDGTAEAGKDFVATTGTLTFPIGSTKETVAVTLIEDDEFEPDETFTVHLNNVSSNAKMGLSSCLCLIIDDHEPGHLAFNQRFHTVKETDSLAVVPVLRTFGGHGRVTVDYQTSDGVAIAGENYAACKGTLVFEDGETAKDIQVPIILDVEPDANMNFCLSLSNAGGGASLGKQNMAVVTILDDGDIEQVTDLVSSLLAQREAMSAGGGDGSFSEQFHEAMECHGGVDHTGQELPPSYGAMTMHCFSLPWKVLFATIPPVKYCGGWATFGIALTYIGLITAIVGDVAGQLGCAMGIEDMVTAISLVALGTSLPDLFASKQAVVDGDDADAAVGNITGSNSVNVFLGLGLPWVIAAIYYTIEDQRFCVPAGSLGFSVIIFSVESIFCLGLIFFRRRFCGGELGGSTATKWCHFTVLVGLWMFYVAISTLQAYGKVGPPVGQESRCTP